MTTEIERGSLLIYEALESALSEKKGCLIGRNGTIELQVLASGESVPSFLRETLELHAGIFPSTEKSVALWRTVYYSSLKNIQNEPIVAGWYKPTENDERELLLETCPKAPHIPLRCLEPYYVEEQYRWTKLLAGKRVAVISSFAKTIEKQIENREKIWGEKADSLLPPDTQWFPVQSRYPHVLAQGRAEWPKGVTAWTTAVRYLVDCVVSKKPDVCLIGCGGIGMIVGSLLKERGIACIVMGGAVQVLFGIKGNRWANHSVISKFWNEAWVWPALEETPQGAGKIEGGCYWKL